jgi:hypothetical protein
VVLRNTPFADPNLVVVLRIILSFAAAALGASIPGFLHVSVSGKGIWIRAGGALALFVLTLFFSPNVVKAEPPSGQPTAEWAEREVAAARKQAEIRDLSLREEQRTAAKLAEERRREAEIGKIITEYVDILKQRAINVAEHVRLRTLTHIGHSKFVEVRRYGFWKQVYNVNLSKAHTPIANRQFSLANEQLAELKAFLENSFPNPSGIRAAKEFFKPLPSDLRDRIKRLLPELSPSLELFEG